uniref:Putative pancreatic lipase-like enzyme n=1 Tax=Ixodes ricinus TaxID=34613 RepID=A0A6B0V198_IXORI
MASKMPLLFSIVQALVYAESTASPSSPYQATWAIGYHPMLEEGFAAQRYGTSWTTPPFETINSGHTTEILRGHGFAERMASKMPLLFSIVQENATVIVVGWLKGAKNFYPEAKQYATMMANGTAELVKTLVDAGAINVSKLHYTGHSLGAQAAGFFAQELKSMVNAVKRLAELQVREKKSHLSRVTCLS